MRRHRLRWPVAVAWLALLPALPGPTYGQSAFALKLEVETGPKPLATSRPSPTGAMLVLNSLNETRRQQLADSLAKLAAAIDKLKNPFFVALDDSEERKELENLIGPMAPAFTAATTLATGHWQSPEGDVRIRPVHHCATGIRCVSLHEVPGPSDIERRARFLAWPLGYAVVISIATPDRVDSVAEAVRASDSTQIALVLTGTELHHLRRSPALKQVLAHARQVVKSMPAKRSPVLSVLAQIANADAAKDTLPWFNLPRDSLLIVPRLGALATSDVFVSDVRARVQATTAKVAWLATPR
jgi:hypothetical protein